MIGQKRLKTPSGRDVVRAENKSTQNTLHATLYFVRLQCFITICISIVRHYIFRSAQQICNKNILKCCVCFREGFPVCQSLITGTQMLNPHFSLWTFDWNNNPLFIPRHDRLLSD